MDISARIVGHTIGLKSNIYRQLDRLQQRRVSRHEIANWHLIRTLTNLSNEIHRQVGIVIDRNGSVEVIMIGTLNHLEFPDGLHPRESCSRLSGYRFLRTEFHNICLSQQDLTDLETRRLDLVAVLEVDSTGFPGSLCIGHIVPDKDSKETIYQYVVPSYHQLDLHFETFIESLEKELQRTSKEGKIINRHNRAILCCLRTPEDKNTQDDIEETKELAHTLDLEIVGMITQFRPKPDPKYCVGLGKIHELTLQATQLSSDIVLFQQNLSPNQTRHITDYTNLHVMDRTQLILDIFAKRANSHDGKLQIELAQLRYAFPRLREKEAQMSRLVGGIGGRRGPGETKLEIHRRRARERIHRLEKEIKKIAQKRHAKRGLRSRRNIPIVAIVGYTNAGKSTLLNALTNANALSENRLFATLDPFSKRLRFPRDQEVILTDTVGFIQNLPPDLIAAFKATLEEIGEANLILHVVDISQERYERRIQVVNELLQNLNFSHIPQMMVLNKMDLVSKEFASNIASSLQGIPISSLNVQTCRPLLEKMENKLYHSSF